MKKTFKKRNYSKYSSKVEHNNTTHTSHHITLYIPVCGVAIALKIDLEIKSNWGNSQMGNA